MQTKNIRDWSVGMVLVVALCASVLSQKVLFADGVHFFIQGAIRPAEIDLLDPRFLAIFLKNAFSSLYYWSGGRDINTALAMFSFGSFMPAVLAVWVMRQRVVNGEVGSAAVLLVLLLGVFLLINFPASELIICHVMNCLLVHGYISGRGKRHPLLFAAGIVVASLSYEISLLTNALFLMWLLADSKRRADYKLQILLHLLGAGCVLAIIWMRGVNGNSTSVFSLKTALSVLILCVVIAAAYVLRRRWAVCLGICLLIVGLVVTHSLPHVAFDLLGRLFRNFSYGSRGVTALITLVTPLMLWSPRMTGWRWPDDWRQGLDALILLWGGSQIVLAVVWSMFWGDYKAAVRDQPVVVTYEQCAACRENPVVYRSGAFAGWTWTWAHMAAVASAEIGLKERRVVIQDVGFTPATPAEYEIFWARFAQAHR